MFPPRVLFILCLGFSLAVHAQEKKDEKPPRTEEEILKTVKLPDGFEATVFAMPPAGGYPTSVSAAVDGTIFVAIDQNGSLGRDRNTADKKPGKVIRMRDTDGDGRADEFKTFAEMESPRGVIWDGPSGTAPGTLYVMYPPKLTAFTDTDGDGVADKQEDILTGLGFDLGFRGADHTTNGCRLAIDGFIYIAVGDYGFTEATAKEGTKLSMRGGGIVRVRPDGTGFEIVSRGQRNIYDVAVSPALDLFTRDNTNDGGGWNVRLSHVPPGAHMGYPTLFINFPEDIVPPLADLGGGSPCGALWIDEPGLPGGLFTVEWGRNAIMRHTLKAKGAGWELVDALEGSAPSLPHGTDGAVPSKPGSSPGQEEWIKLTRPTDMDVDASGRIYITSWEGATFNYNGPNAGYVLRVVKKDAPKVVVPDLGKATPFDLAGMIESPSAALRLTAQRELFRRSAPRAELERAIERLAALVDERDGPSNQRIAALQVATGLAKNLYVDAAGSSKAAGTMSRKEALALLLSATGLAEQKMRLLGDGVAGAETKNDDLAKGCSDKNPRVRAAAITALRRRGKADAAPSILPLVADADPIISHLAIRALRELKASQACLAALDSPDEKVKPGALKALYGIYEPEVVDGLIQRLGSQASRLTGGPAASAETADFRRHLLNALCRLANEDAPYLDPKEWWGTRPDTSGPVYKPAPWSESDRIQAALKRELDSAKGEDARWLVQRMYVCKVNVPGLVEQMLAACGNDTPARLAAVEGMFRPDQWLPAQALAALQATATDEGEPPESRARALRLLQRASAKSGDGGGGFAVAVDTFAKFAGHNLSHAALTAAFEDFTRDGKNAKVVGSFEALVKSNDAGKRALGATVLVNLATSALVKGKEQQAATTALENSWAKPESAAALLSAIARTKSKALAPKVEAHLQHPNNAVAEAALFAHQALGLGGGGAAMPLIGTLKYEEVFASVAKGGDAKAGQEIFLRAGCIACHTIDANEPPKGPILSAVAKMYDRAALTESILKPNAKLAQGFESTWIKTKKGEQLEGFVTREGGDNLDLRNVVGQTVLVEKADIAERGHREQSMMPEGLLNAFTPAELANLLAWMESLKAAK